MTDDDDVLDDLDLEDEPDEPEATFRPFISVRAEGETEVRVRAGMLNDADDSVDRLVFNDTVPLNLAGQAMQTAFQWYQNRVLSILNQQAQAAEGDGEGEPEQAEVSAE